MKTLSTKFKTKTLSRLICQLSVFAISLSLASNALSNPTAHPAAKSPRLIGEFVSSAHHDSINMNGVAQTKSVIQDQNGDLIFSSDDGATALASVNASATTTQKQYASKATAKLLASGKSNATTVHQRVNIPTIVADTKAAIKTAQSYALAYSKNLKIEINKSNKSLIVVPRQSEIAQNGYFNLAILKPLLNYSVAMNNQDMEIFMGGMFALAFMPVYTQMLRKNKKKVKVNASRRSFAFNTRMALHDILGFTQLLQEERAGNISSVRKQYLEEIMVESKGILANLNSIEKQTALSNQDLSFNLRTELFSIIGFAQLFSSEKLGLLTSKQKEFISEVIRESDSILKLVPTD